MKNKRIVLKKNVNFEELERIGFLLDGNYWDEKLPYYTYGFLAVRQTDRCIFVLSGKNNVNGSDELLKFYEMINKDMVEILD